MNAGNRATELRGADRAEGLPGHCRLAVSRYGGPMGIYRKDSAEAHVAEGRDGGKPVAGALQDGKQFLLGDPRLGRNAGRSTEADPDRGQLMSGVDNQNVFAVPARNHQGRPIVSTTARAHSPTPAVSPIGDHNHVVGGRRNAGPKRFGTDLSGPVPKCLHVKTDGAREGGGLAPHTSCSAPASTAHGFRKPGRAAEVPRPIGPGTRCFVFTYRTSSTFRQPVGAEYPTRVGVAILSTPSSQGAKYPGCSVS